MTEQEVKEKLEMTEKQLNYFLKLYKSLIETNKLFKIENSPELLKNLKDIQDNLNNLYLCQSRLFGIKKPIIPSEQDINESEPRCKNCYWSNGFLGICLVDLDPNYPDDICPDPDYFMKGVGEAIDQHDFWRSEDPQHVKKLEANKNWKMQAALHKMKIQEMKRAREQGGKY